MFNLSRFGGYSLIALGLVFSSAGFSQENQRTHSEESDAKFQVHCKSEIRGESYVTVEISRALSGAPIYQIDISGAAFYGPQLPIQSELCSLKPSLYRRISNKEEWYSSCSLRNYSFLFPETVMNPRFYHAGAVFRGEVFAQSSNISKDDPFPGKRSRIALTCVYK